MAKEVKNIFHWLLLGIIPAVFLLAFLNGADNTDLQLQDTFIGSTMRLDIGLSIVLVIKALLYYLTRTYRFSRPLCYFDILLTAVVCVWAFFPSTSMHEGQALEVDLKLMLLITVWVLIQFFVFINFFVHLLMRTDRSIEYKED